MKKLYSLLALMLMATLGFVANAATAKVYIDNKDGVILYINGDNWDMVQDKLVNGEFVDITFTAGLTWNLDSSNHLTYYQIKRNCEVIASKISPVFDIGFDFEVADGDIIEILVKDPNPSTSEKATISVDYGTCGDDVIKYITVDDNDVDVVNGKFEATLGAQILVFPNDKSYTIKSIMLGTQELSYVFASNCYVGIIEGDATLTVDAEAKAAAEITLAVNDAEAVTVYTSSSGWWLGTEVSGLSNGDNKLSVNPSESTIEVKVNSGYEIVSATYTDADGNVKDMTYDSWGEYYYVDAIGSNVVSINIATKEKVVEMVTFGIEISDVSLLKSYFLRVNKPRRFLAHSDDPTMLLHNGINTFTVTAEEAASLRINLEFTGDPITDVTINGTPVKGVKYDSSDNSVWGDFSIENGQIMLIGESSGISSVTVSPEVTKVYNLQGIEMRSDSLPAGIYIINGKKTYLRK